MTTPRKIINSEYDRMQAPLTAQYQFERAERLQAELATLRSMTRDYPGGTPVADALQRVSQIQADNTNIAAWVQKDRELAALRKLADAVRSHGIGAELGQLREQRAGLSEYPPMGWLAQELAEGTTPVVISPVECTGSRGRANGYPRELVLIDPHDGAPAKLAITNLKTGHTDAFELPEGVRLAVPPF